MLTFWREGGFPDFTRPFRVAAGSDFRIHNCNGVARCSLRSLLVLRPSDPAFAQFQDLTYPNQMTPIRLLCDLPVLPIHLLHQRLHRTIITVPL